MTQDRPRSESKNPHLEPGDDAMKLSRAARLRRALLGHRESAPAPSVELDRPIPTELEAPAGWKELPLRESGEDLIPVGPFSDHDTIFTSAVYYGEHSNSPYMGEKKLEETLITMFARESVVNRLEQAQSLLPERHYLIVLDSYRSLDVQKALYDHYYGALERQRPDWSADELTAETQKYVSLPSSDATRPSPHNTGGSVDLAIFTLPPETDARCQDIDREIALLKDEDQIYLLQMEKISLLRRHSEFLDFGTQFDFGGQAAQSNYFELLEQERELTAEEAEARDNRRLLYNVMVASGMQPYVDEWWHFNAPESQMGAITAGLDHAEFGGLALDDEHIKHETMRRGHHGNLVRAQENLMSGLEAYNFAGKLDPTTILSAPQRARLQELRELNVRALNETGDPRLTSLPKAAIIAPPDVAAA